MDDKWKYYAIAPLLIWGYSVMGNPKGNIVRNLWIGYCILGGILGMDLLKFKDDDNNRV